MKWHGTCYVNWAILIGDQADVTTLLLHVSDIISIVLVENKFQFLDSQIIKFVDQQISCRNKFLGPAKKVI